MTAVEGQDTVGLKHWNDISAKIGEKVREARYLPSAAYCAQPSDDKSSQ